MIDSATYLKLLCKTINQVWATPGRHEYSVAQTSFDAWTRYYRPDENSANATVSYYTRAVWWRWLSIELAATVSRRWIATHAGWRDAQTMATGSPITHADIAQALADEAQQLPQRPAYRARGVAAAWAEVLHAWTETTVELPLPLLLAGAAVAWNAKPAPLPQRLGARLSRPMAACDKP